MKIVLCIKQVPDTSDIQWTENNTIQRDGVESIINPSDCYAIETALKIKDEIPEATISVLTMGPPQAVEILKSAISVGADEAFLVSDRKFAAADTIATSRTLTAAIKTTVPDYDLIICGQFAIDGDTAQTGPSIAQKLGVPQVTYVQKLVSCDKEKVVVEKEVEDGVEVLQVETPALLCVKSADELRRPLISGFEKALKADIKVLSAEDIGLDASEVGMKGSPTYVSKAFRPEQKSSGEIIVFEDSEKTAGILKQKISEYLK